jgi:uncharacterized membrane protein SpoIIM required for sporulation/ABC-type transport system involved in multi-copper enzyme maturation permease subunit
MSLSAVRSVARREVTETLTDWRILAPIFILSILLPQLVIGATTFALRFVDRDSIVRLVPFVMLLVGFIPASFSLIAALESFVGERERNSLESLLAMPISDSALYTGKLVAALTAPLFSAMLAMLLFALSLRLRAPDLYREGLLPEYLVGALVLILVKSIVMVAGAVIISSHTTSIRAANLLASFVLLPTASVIQIEALLIIGRRWDVLWLTALALAIIAIALIRTGMGAFNREEILSREHEQLQLSKTWSDFKRFLAEYQPPGVPPGDYTGRPFSAQHFYRRDLPALLRDYRTPIGVALFAALCGIAAGGYVGSTYRIPMVTAMVDNVGIIPEPSLGLALYVFGNNVRVALLSNLFSMFTFGVLAFLVPSVVFAQISFVSTVLVERGGSWLEMGPGSPLQFILAYLLPHGIVELPTAILSAAIGLRLGVALLTPPPGFTVGQNMLWSLAQFWKVWALVLVPLFLVAALLEGFVMPLVVRALYT